MSIDSPFYIHDLTGLECGLNWTIGKVRLRCSIGRIAAKAVTERCLHSLRVWPNMTLTVDAKWDAG